MKTNLLERYTWYLVVVECCSLVKLHVRLFKQPYSTEVCHRCKFGGGYVLLVSMYLLVNSQT